MSPTTDTLGEIGARYLWFARAFDYPVAAFWDAPAASANPLAALSQEEREAAYLAAFELGGDSPPVPLYEGHCRLRDGREGILKDVLRFYEYFDVRLREDNRDYPDHLVTELEFLAVLAAREARAVAEGRDAGPYRRAARDFLSRHLAVWLPELVERLKTAGTPYAALARQLLAMLRAHEVVLERNEQGDRA